MENEKKEIFYSLKGFRKLSFFSSILVGAICVFTLCFVTAFKLWNGTKPLEELMLVSVYAQMALSGIMTTMLITYRSRIFDKDRPMLNLLFIAVILVPYLLSGFAIFGATVMLVFSLWSIIVFASTSAIGLICNPNKLAKFRLEKLVHNVVLNYAVLIGLFVLLKLFGTSFFSCYMILGSIIGAYFGFINALEINKLKLESDCIHTNRELNRKILTEIPKLFINLVGMTVPCNVWVILMKSAYMFGEKPRCHR